jgi:hypothetical protein
MMAATLSFDNLMEYKTYMNKCKADGKKALGPVQWLKLYKPDSITYHPDRDAQETPRPQTPSQTTT